jgi:uncharacterized OB-fold protein
VAEPATHRLLPHAAPFAEQRDAIRLQHCGACGAYPEFPRIACPRCLGELEWVEASGRGRVFTFGVVRRPHHVRFEHELPIVLAVIELDEGTLVISNVVGDDRLETEIGSPVELAVEGTFALLPQFRLAK